MARSMTMAIESAVMSTLQVRVEGALPTDPKGEAIFCVIAGGLQGSYLLSCLIQSTADQFQV